ncbi:MAG: YraN family protein [Victivallales bacterium]|nr:YraN family protein [Victivallales bacterium]
MNYFAAKARHLRLGAKGEKIASRLLRQKNYSILCRNFKVKSGEIDLVARDGETLVFVEVKTRHARTNTRHYLRPAENLSARQKERIYRAAQSYLAAIGNPAVTYRFDLVEVILSPFELQALRHWENNFSRPARYDNN